MEYKYVAAFKVRGLIHDPERGDVEIYADANQGVRAVLTDKVHEHCYELDQAHAISFILLKGLVGQRESEDFRKEIEVEIGRIRDRKEKELNGSEVLIFTATGEANADFSRPCSETEDFVIGFDIIKKDTIVAVHDLQVNAALTGLFLSYDQSTLQITQLYRDVYLINDHQKPVFSFKFSGSGDAYGSSRTTSEVVDKAKSHCKILVGERSLSKVNRLVIQALSGENDKLRRFMFAWTALEILINKVFSEYERQFLEKLVGPAPQKHVEKYFTRIRDVMKDKYRLADKFTILTACLGDEEAELDLNDFGSIKGKRDSLFHGETVDEETLPIAQTIGLLKKYLRLHISTKT